MLRAGMLAVLGGLLFPVLSHAQAIVPAVNPGLFEPEVDIVESGIKHDVQATVSADRKYVTMTMRPQNAQLLALRTFAFQTGQAIQGGVVGGVNPVVGGAGGAGGGIIPQQPNSPMKVAPGNGGVILMQRGITPLVLDK